MCAGSLLFFISFNLMLPELPTHLRKIGGGEYLGWIISSFSIFALLARPVSGVITDRLGRKWAMMGGTAFCVIAGVLYPITGVLWLFFLVRGIHGFSSGIAPTGFTAFTADIIPPARRGEALGWQGMFSNIGSSAGFALGAAVIALTGVNGMYMISSAMALIALLLFATLPETGARKRSNPEGWRGMFYFKAWKPALIMLLVCIPIGSLITIMPDYTVMMGYENKGLYLSVYIAASLLVRIFSGRLSDRLGRPVSTAIGSGFQVVALSLLVAVESIPVFFISAVLYGFGQGFNAPSIFAWAGDTSDEHTRGRAMGMLFIAMETGIIFGSLGAGELFNLDLLNFSSVFIFNLACAAITLVTSFIFIKKGA